LALWTLSDCLNVRSKVNGEMKFPVGRPICSDRDFSRSKRFMTRPVGRAAKFLFPLAFYIVVSVIVIVVSPARDNIGTRMRRHYFDTAVVLTAVRVESDTTWTDAKA
jgi:hypothetical protein